MNDQDNNNLPPISGRRKRKSNVFDNICFPSSPNPRRLISASTPLLENNMNHLNLTLGPSQPCPPSAPPLQTHFYPQLNDYYIPLPNQEAVLQLPPPPPLPSNPPRPPRIRRATTRQQKSETISPPYQWATDRRAKVHTLEYLLSNQIYTITGEVQCKKCERKYELGFNLKDKFMEVAKFVVENKPMMHDRAPGSWSNPILPTCRVCEAENSLKPVISDKKRSINWLFLFLGQMLGCCTLEQLKYFCKHTYNHRTGAKDRVLYLAYLCMCKQLDPLGPFSR